MANRDNVSRMQNVPPREKESAEERKVGPIQKAVDFLKSLTGPLWWVFPIAMAAISMIPASLRKTFSEYATVADLPWMHFFVQVVFGIAWVGSGFFNVTNTTTPVSALKKDAFISTTIYSILLFGTGWLMSSGQMPVGLVLPLLAALVDVYVTPDRAINNAAQKPIVQQQQVGA